MKLRTPYFAMFLAASLMIAALAAHLIHVPSASRNFGLFLGSLHAPGFGVLAILLMLLLRNPNRPLRTYLTATIIGIVISGFGEFIQIFGPRDADLLDFGHSVLGIVGFLGLAALLDPKLDLQFVQKHRSVALAVTALFVLGSIGPMCWYAYAAAAQRHSFPVLLSFESAWEREFFDLNYAKSIVIESSPADWPVKSSRAARLVTAKTSYPGISILPYPNWEGFDSFSFVIASADGQPHQMSLSIYDRQTDYEFTDRFNISFPISPDPQRFRISLDTIRNAPADRKLDLRSIAAVILFMSHAKGDEEILLDDFRLEND